METDIYRQLAKHLDRLPGGYPATESGVELRILRRLFTPEEAELATHLTLIPEAPRVIARRARIRLDEAEERLAEMEGKGLIYAIHRPGRTPHYQALQFVVGLWEFQVHDLDEAFVRDMEEYRSAWFDPENWRRAPQLRTIPIGQSIEAPLAVMPYEQAETLVRTNDRISVAPCICRREKKIVGEGCDRPEETCLSFGNAADFYVRNALGRPISQAEALEILALANEAGLVLQPSNSREAAFLCSCCGCCCGVLRSIKRHPQPATLVSSPFVASLDAEACTGCETCLDRCQMEALSIVDGVATLDLGRCIGCGLCVSTCPAGALALTRKPASQQEPVPADYDRAMIRLGEARGTLTKTGMVRMLVRSKVDRLLATL
jgi:electron transport complex protein RnfB